MIDWAGSLRFRGIYQISTFQMWPGIMIPLFAHQNSRCMLVHRGCSSPHSLGKGTGFDPPPLRFYITPKIEWSIINS